MALTGTFPRTLDEKFRLAVPKRLRDDFDESPLKTLIVAPGTEKSLSLYSDTEFSQLAERLGQKSKTSDVKNYIRLFYSRAERVDLDSQGRIRLPERLVKFAELEHEIVLVGVNDHAEAWAQDAWQEFLNRTEASFDELAASIDLPEL